MICRGNEAREDESPAKVVVNTRTLGEKWSEGEGVRMRRRGGWVWVKVGQIYS